MIEKNFRKLFDITRPIYLNSESSDKFLEQNAFLTIVPPGFSDIIYQNNYNSRWKKFLGFLGCMQIHLCKIYSLNSVHFMNTVTRFSFHSKL